MRIAPGAGRIAVAGLIMMTGTQVAAGSFRLPAWVERKLGNGVRLYAMEYHELPLVDLEVVVAAGAALDPPGREGLADLVADLLRKGTATRSAREIADAVDFAGGSLSASADQDAARVSAEFLSRDADLALDLLLETLTRPAFAPEEVDRIRSETINELKAVRENPGLLASRRFIELLYGDHPYGHPNPGWEKTVGAITTEDVRRFYQSHYTPDNTIVVAVGDFKAEEMLGRLESRFSSWSGRAAARREVPEPEAPAARAVYLVDKPDATQSQIRIGGIGIRRTDPDYPVLHVANTILGGGFTSRLVEEIRVNRGLSYGASSRFYPLVQNGPFLINTFTKNETTLQTVKVALEVLEGFRRDGPKEDEMDKARKYLKGAFAISHQSPDSLADALGDIAFYGLPRDYYDTYLDRIAGVTAADVRRVLPRFPFDRALIVVLGQAGAVRKDLETLGPVKVVPLAGR